MPLKYQNPLTWPQRICGVIAAIFGILGMMSSMAFQHTGSVTENNGAVILLGIAMAFMVIAALLGRKRKFKVINGGRQ